MQMLSAVLWSSECSQDAVQSCMTRGSSGTGMVSGEVLGEVAMATASASR